MLPEERAREKIDMFSDKGYYYLSAIYTAFDAQGFAYIVKDKNILPFTIIPLHVSQVGIEVQGDFKGLEYYE